MENLSKEIIFEILYKHRKEIRNFEVKKLILFGSYAKNKQNKNSDIDFLVKFEKGRYLFRNHGNHNYANTAYVSSDCYVVLVANYAGTSYIGATFDLHQTFSGYSWQDIKIVETTQSNSLTGVY